MSYIDRSLIPGEAVQYRTRLHWIVMIGPFLWALAIAAGGAALLAYASSEMHGAPGAAEPPPVDRSVLLWAAAGMFVLAFLMVLLARWRRSATEMAVTNKRVLIKKGMLTHRSVEIVLSKIESVIVDQAIGGRILGYGTIVVRGTGGTPEPFAKIAHPLEFRKQVQQQIDQLPQTTPTS
jgi:uncharacterized membrane protein YdbT with pleckstrin-like domain